MYSAYCIDEAQKQLRLDAAVVGGGLAWLRERSKRN